MSALIRHLLMQILWSLDRQREAALPMPTGVLLPVSVPEYEGITKMCGLDIVRADVEKPGLIIPLEVEE